jgi:4-diphosphocytidyl-2-C-methyl-D-erythritol kinase
VTPAPAKINLALVVGPLREDGKHEVLSVLAPIQLADQIDLSIADELEVAGFAEDTLVRDALEALASAAGVDPRWRVTIEKRIPVAAGLGGGSSDAATALLLANATLAEPLSQRRLHELAAGLGADIPFFLEPGPKLARGDGTDLEPVKLPRDFTVVLFLPDGVAKSSTASVYDAFDARRGADGFGDRAAALEGAMQAGDLATLPSNDLASSPHAARLKELGAFRADVTGAGPVVYGLFSDRDVARETEQALASSGRIWLDRPGW